MVLKKVDLLNKKLDDYKKLISPKIYKEILRRSKRLKNLKIVHINATAIGGGVAEMLKTIVPLMRDVGLDANWYVIQPDKKFFDITKKLHNSLQGDDDDLTKLEKEYYLSYNKKISQAIEKIKGDILVIHDPQPLASLSFLDKKVKAVWRCHIDTTNCNIDSWNFIENLLRPYNYFVFSLKDFIPKDLPRKKIKIIHPAIDPLTIKNRLIDVNVARYILSRLGIDIDKPILTQVSRFDPWKDPLGVIRTFYLAKKRIPDLQLVLCGLFLAKDDPEAIKIYKEVKYHVKNKPNIFLFSDPEKIKYIGNELLVNALQTGSDVIIQKSIREGFGLVVAEAMWKYKAVVGSNVGGIKIQIKDGFNGFLVNNVKTAAQRVVQLLENKDMAQKMGRMAHKSVQEKFLMPRLLNDWLELFERII